jgi:hypothetical protein
MTPQTDVLPVLVEDMLLDAGFGQDDRLRSALLSLGSLASLPAPVPSGELAALLAEDGASREGGELGRRRWLRAQRPPDGGAPVVPTRGPAPADIPAASSHAVKGRGQSQPGRGNDVGSGAPRQVAGAVLDVLADAAGGTLQPIADTAGATLTAIPGNSWLQRFNR